MQATSPYPASSGRSQARPVQRAAERGVGERCRILPCGDHGRLPRAAGALDLVGWKRRPLDDIGEQRQRRGKLRRQRIDAVDGRVARGAGAVVGAELRERVGDRQRIARRRAVLERGDREIDEARRVAGIDGESTVHHQSRVGDRYLGAFEVIDGETVGEPERRGLGQATPDRGARAGRALAPRLVAIDRLGLASVRRHRRGGHVGCELLLAGRRVQHDARVLREILRDGTLHVVRRDFPIALEILREVARIAGVLVVVIEPVRPPAAAADALQPAEQVVLVGAARTVDLRLRRPVAREPREFRIDRRLELGRRVTGARKRLDLEYRRERARRLAGVDALCELLVVDERLVQAARLAAGEDLSPRCRARRRPARTPAASATRG